MEKKKKKFIKPTVTMLQAYDVESDLMYGGITGGGATGGFFSGSATSTGSSSGSGTGIGGTDTGNSDLAKGGFWMDF